MNKLYPIKFKPIFKELIWGGTRLKEVLNKSCNSPSTGESWEISGVADNLSIVSNGFLKGNSIQEIIEIYMGEMVGDKIFKRFGLEFPLLIKFIDANDILSIQVHPDDKLARERHNAFGKTEMWYIIQAEKGSRIITGFNTKINREVYLDHFRRRMLPEILNYEESLPGDVFFIPAGRVHAIGSGILLAEIQQTSDITYRIHDWDRLDSNGKGRELHTDFALDAINYESTESSRIQYDSIPNSNAVLVDCPYFTTSLINFDTRLEKDFNLIDSFVIYMCIEGSVDIQYSEDPAVNIKKGETVLIPAELKNIIFKPKEAVKLLEIYIK